MATSCTVFTPESMGKPGASDPALLILLHGLTGNHAVWAVRTDLQALADKHHMVIVLPDGERSFWIDQEYGLKWGTWVGEELPALVRHTMRVSDTRAKTFIGGLSMGGYGAFRAAFDHPETFAGAFALSGVLDVSEDAFRTRHGDLYEIGFGNPDSPRPEDDLVARLGNKKQVTRLHHSHFFACCGEDDALINMNRVFVDAAKAVHLNIVYRESAGEHNYRYWNEWLPVALDKIVGLPDQ